MKLGSTEWKDGDTQLGFAIQAIHLFRFPTDVPKGKKRQRRKKVPQKREYNSRTHTELKANE
jgi:hypothetical protein